ncbi:hypothetical protein GWK47_016995 [Chionoecetes opilio]|uniref:Uncharacterized protein n=1 Tax=Chionoecetes opilio TaxID=41210 RepID=A0A8J4XU19_CHIOP|nr:hypothetical protein GWK47_016995 [Chionoecetes opilio]
MMLEAKKSRPTCELITAGGFEEVTKVASSHGSDVEQLQSSHEEADTRIILHAKAAYMDGYERIIVSCRDTDVLVLLTHAAGQSSGELWMRTGTRQERRYVAVHDIQLTPTLQRNILVCTMRLQDVTQSVNQVDTGKRRHGKYSSNTEHCLMTSDVARCQNPPYGMWKSSSAAFTHQLRTKLTSTMCDTACFKRAPKTKKSFRQVENVLNNTSNAHTTRLRCGSRQMYQSLK